MKFKWQRIGIASLAMMLAPTIAMAHPGADQQLLPFAIIHGATHQLIRLPGAALLLLLLALLAIVGFRASKHSRSSAPPILFNHSSHAGRNTDVESSP